MRYNISPAERNELEENYKVRSVPPVTSGIPKLRNFDIEEAATLHEQNRSDKQKLYGRMRTRVKPVSW